MTEQQAAYLAGAIAHANDSLDWIEARKGPLPEDGYARIETSVGVVRALAGRETTVRGDAAHPSADFEMMPDLVCGRSYRNPESEAQAVAMRTCEVTPYTGCGKPMRWVYAYRCRQCGRWMHGPCMDRHFGVVGYPATRDGQVDLTAENERLRWAVSGGKEIIDGQAARIRALTAENARLRERVAALEGALKRARLWLDGAAETFGEAMDCGEEPSDDHGDCANHDSYCDRYRDMNRGIAEIDAALRAGQPAAGGA